MPKPRSRTAEGALELAAEDIFNETLLDRLPVGVVVLDRHGDVVKYNRFEENLAGRRRQDVIGRNFFTDVARCTDVPEIAGRVRTHLADDTLSAKVEFAFDLPFLPEPRDVLLLLQSFRVNGDPFAVVVVEDISLRKELERERERLLTVLMHDLRNPLSGVLGYAELLSQGALGKTTRAQKKALDTILQSARTVSGLLDTTLDQLRGRQRRLRSVNLHALVLSATASHLPAARRARVEVIYHKPLKRAEFPTQAVAVRGDPNLLSSALHNLLGNALKYARSRVEVRVRRSDEGIELEVEDDGPGISPEHRPRLFERGYRVPGSKPGQGLGLHSVRRVMAEHGGRVEVAGEPGGGAVLRLVLPAPEADQGLSGGGPLPTARS